tara:strand:+ start:271 stop:450 length:180 start_codon:yes stop_codon:yes gene_type:complete
LNVIGKFARGVIVANVPGKGAVHGQVVAAATFGYASLDFGLLHAATIRAVELDTLDAVY